MLRARDGRGGGGPATAPGPHLRVVERGEERATRAGALPRPVRRPRRRVQRRRGVAVVVVVGGNRRAKAGVVVVVSAGAPVGPGARALGPGRRRRAARTSAAPGCRSRDPAPPGRAAVRGAPRRVIIITHPPSRLDAKAPAGGENRQAAPAVGAVQAVERVTPPARVGRRRVVRREASRPAARRVPARGEPGAVAVRASGGGRPRRSVQILRRRARLRRRSPRRLRARVGLALDRIIGALFGALIGALFGALIGRRRRLGEATTQPAAAFAILLRRSVGARRVLPARRFIFLPGRGRRRAGGRAAGAPDSGGGWSGTRRAGRRRRIRPVAVLGADAFAERRRRRVAG